MSIGVQLNAVFNIDNTTYTANMSLPTSAPTATAPFLFDVTTQPQGGSSSTILTVAVGASNQVYVAVAPPGNLISQAVGSDIVQSLNIVVSEGTYDPTKHQFTA